MDTCVIFCAGGFEKLIRQPDASDYILAADGGLNHLRKLGIAPQGIIGDFDSLPNWDRLLRFAPHHCLASLCTDHCSTCVPPV